MGFVCLTPAINIYILDIFDITCLVEADGIGVAGLPVAEATELITPTDSDVLQPPGDAVGGVNLAVLAGVELPAAHVNKN